MCENGCKQSPINLPGPDPIETRLLNVKLRNYENIAYPAKVQRAYGWLGVDAHQGEMEVTFPNGSE